MLQLIRDRLKGWVAFFIFFIVALAFVFFGVDPITRVNNSAATVNGEEISLSEVRRAYQVQISQYQRQLQDEVPPAIASQLRSRVLDNFIAVELLEQKTNSLGYRVSDKQVIESIRQQPQFQVAGQFSEDSYRAQLGLQGTSTSRFEEEQRGQLALQQLQQAIASSSFVTPSEMRRYIALENELREISYLTISSASFQLGVDISDEEIQEYYDANGVFYMTPETVTVEYVEIRATDSAADASVTDEELQDHYDLVKEERYKTEEQRRGSHILLTINDDQSDDEKIRAEAESLLARVQAGEALADLAREYSRDGGTAPDGGDLGWASREDFVGPFADALYELEPGGVTGPVKTQFGYHIIQLDDIQPGGVKSFEEVRAEIELEVRRMKSESTFVDQADELDREAFAAGSELASVAEALEIELKAVTGFTRSGGGELGSGQKVIETVFSDEVLIDRENSPMIAVADDHAMVLRVVEHNTPRQKPLDEVSEEIREVLVSSRGRTGARELGESALQRLRDGETLSSIATELSKNLNLPGFVSRSQSDVPTEILGSAFRASKPQDGVATVGGTTMGNGDYSIFSVSAVLEGNNNALPLEQRKQQQAQLAGQLGFGELTGYLGAIRAASDININQQAFEDDFSTQRPVAPVLP